MNRLRHLLVGLATLTLVSGNFSSSALASSCQGGLSIEVLRSHAELTARARYVFMSYVRSYACMDIVNYFADKLNLASAVVVNNVHALPGGTEVVFENKIHQGLCGARRLMLPREAKDQLDGLRLALSEMVLNEFRAASKEASRSASEWTERYIPDGASYPRPSSEYVTKAIDELVERLQRGASRIIVEKSPMGMKGNSVETGVGCTISIPEVTDPDATKLRFYPDAFAAYQELSQDLEKQLK